MEVDDAQDGGPRKSNKSKRPKVDLIELVLVIIVPIANFISTFWLIPLVCFHTLNAGWQFSSASSKCGSYDCSCACKCFYI